MGCDRHPGALFASGGGVERGTPSAVELGDGLHVVRAERRLAHLQVQAPARLVWMVEHGLLVELDAQPRLGGGDQVALLPAQRLLQDRIVEPAPDGLQDQEVRTAEGDVRGSRMGDRPAVDVRCDG